MQLIALLATLGCGTSQPSLSGRIAWVSEATSVPTVRWAEADHPAGEHTIDGIPGGTFPAAPDPHGTDLLIVSSVDDAAGHQESLWLVPLNGGEPRALGEPAQMLRNPAWSPDGEWLVYESNLRSFRDLYRVERDGKLQRLTNDKTGNYEPDVARDGSIAFVSSRDGNAEIYVMGPLGQQPMRITHHPGNDTNPVWSPDGGHLAWLAWRGEQIQAQLIERGELRGRALRAEVDPSELDRELRWSPTGDRVAITTQIGPKDLAIDIVALSGERIARLDGPGPDEHPCWSPDGAHLVFSSSRAGQPDLYVAKADGSGIRPLVHSPAAEWLPRWIPGTN